jgi:hypothetical protein
MADHATVAPPSSSTASAMLPNPPIAGLEPFRVSVTSSACPGRPVAIDNSEPPVVNATVAVPNDDMPIAGWSRIAVASVRAGPHPPRGVRQA